MDKSKTETKYQLNYSSKVKEVVLDLVKRFSLEIDSKLSLRDRLERKDPEIVIFHLAERIVNKEGKFKDISDTLKKDLGMHQEGAEKLAHDIKNKIVPLAEIIMPKEEEEDGETVETIKEPSAQELLIEKLKKGIPDNENIGDRIQKSEYQKPAEQKPPVTVKKVEVKDVEENAEDLKKQREETAKPGTAGGELRKGQSDKYRESVG